MRSTPLMLVLSLLMLLLAACGEELDQSTSSRVLGYRTPNPTPNTNTGGSLGNSQQQQSDSSNSQADQFDADGSRGVNDESSLVRVIVRNYQHLDGCGYLLERQNGEKLLPTNLPSSYAIDGLLVQVSYQLPSTTRANTCMAGQQVELTVIQ